MTESADSQGALKTVLVVDDDLAFLEMVKSRLLAEGYAVVTAVDGADGLTKLSDVKADLIVLDVLMPFINGHTFVKILKSYPRYKSIPVIIFTAKDDLQEMFEAEGIKHYLIKPFNADTFIAKVKRLLADERTQ